MQHQRRHRGSISGRCGRRRQCGGAAAAAADGGGRQYRRRRRRQCGWSHDSTTTGWWLGTCLTFFFRTLIGHNELLIIVRLENGAGEAINGGTGQAHHGRFPNFVIQGCFHYHPIIRAVVVVI